MSTKTTVVEWCLRCRSTFEIDNEFSDAYDEDDAIQVCPNAPDHGPHEPLVMDPNDAVRTGSSLHVGRCPRHNPSPYLPREVRCQCRSGVQSSES